MRKFIIVLLLMCILSSPIIIAIVSAIMMTKQESLEYLINKGYYKPASRIMSKEIIRQLKEKEDMTLENYFIRLYFRRMMKEKMLEEIK